MIGVPHPLVIWSCAVVALALGLRQRARRARPAAARQVVPVILRVGCALPAPAGLVDRVPVQSVTPALAVAGLPRQVDTRTVARAQLGLATGAAVPAMLLALAGPVGVVLGLVTIVLAYLLPARWLVAVGRRRRRRVVRALPDLIDLVAICATSGLALEPSIRIAAERLPGALSDELTRTLRELDLGTPRRAAYRALADRVGAPPLSGFVGAVLQADELGVPMVGVLRRQAEQLRMTRRQDMRDHAARAAPKVQLVVAMVMVPAALLVVVGVLVIQLIGQLGGVAGGIT